MAMNNDKEKVMSHNISFLSNYKGQKSSGGGEEK